ncbi:MAG: RCC1 repeat- and reductase domain-containing protein [Nitrosomonadaceae bacterium]|nr:RCC1 repeat- and reductase domain-containing protein [Nitrosomonadaceae bacterium]
MTRSAPVKVNGLTDVTDVVSGAIATVALKNDGTVWAWGWNARGDLGNGRASIKEVQYTPVQIIGLTDVIAIGENGKSSFYAIKEDGTLWSWGCQAKNVWGDSGNCPFSASPRLPSQISEFSDVINFQSGGGTIAGESINSNYVLESNGTIWSWGSNFVGQLGDGTNSDTILPHGITGSDRDTPEQVAGLTGVKEIAVVVAPGVKVFALKKDGTVWGWGDNDLGRLGTGMTITTVDKPTQVSELTGIIKISADTFNTLALRNDGTVWAWGSYNLYGAIGVGAGTSTVTPVQLVELHDIVDIKTNGLASYALKGDGTIWGWGSGPLKTGGGAEAKYLTPIQICNLPGITNIVFGIDFVPHLIRNDGTVWKAYFDGCTQL